MNRAVSPPVTTDHLLVRTTEDEPQAGLPSEQVRDNEGRPSGMMDRSSLLIETIDESADNADQPQHVRLRQTPIWGATVNTIAFMAVPRSIPACFAATGWTLGILSLVYSTVVTYDTGLLLGRVCTTVPASCCSFPGLAAEASGTLAARLGLPPAKQARWRRAGSVCIAILQHSCYYLTGVAELIYFEQYLGQMFELSPLCQWQWLVIVGVLSLPVVQVPSFNASKFLALFFGVVPLLLNVGVMLCARAAAIDPSRPQLRLPPLRLPPLRLLPLLQNR